MSYIYPKRESKSLEFKAKLPNFHQLIKTVVAFANGGGGQIIVGVDDKSRHVIGVDEETRHRVYDEFPNSVYDATSPSLLLEIYEKRFDDVSVMIIEVPNSIKKPVFIKSEGLPEGVYLRAGSSTRRANIEYIEELMRENKRVYFDEEAVAAEADILSKALLQRIFGQADSARLVTEKVLTQAGARIKKYVPTVAGALAFCEMPHRYVPEAVIHCTRFQGVAGRDIIQSEEIQGCLEQQLEHSFALLRSWLLRNYQLIDTKLAGTTLVPEPALREAISNALLHRKYSIPGAIKIALYDDRLEIFSPGNFPGMIDIHHLGDGTTYLRNPHLARIARRFGIVEKLGTGIRLILESCRQAGLKAPNFIEGADSVKVIFYFKPHEDVPSTKDSLLTLFDMQAALKVEDVQSTLGVSRNTATRRLNLLLNSGEIKRIGKGPAVRYVRQAEKSFS